MALRITLTYLGEPDPESTTVTLPIPNVGMLGRGVPQALTERVMAHFPGEEAEALAHRLADLYNRNQRLPRLRVDTQDGDESAPDQAPDQASDQAPESSLELIAEPQPETTPETDAPGDGSPIPQE